ncbi:MAG TPA: hypothetical protein VIL16_17425 [Trebonia sp.]
MRLSARADYALRAAIELAAAPGVRVTAEVQVVLIGYLGPSLFGLGAGPRSWPATSRPGWR